MRFGKRSRWLVAVLAVLVLAAPCAWSQAKAPAKTPAQAPVKEPAKTTAKAPAKAKTQAPAPAPTKAPAQAPPKAPAKGPAKPAAQAAKKPAVTSVEATGPSMAGRRDPFAPLVQISQRGGQTEAPECKETGVRGLVISTLRVDGIVKTQSGMIAVVSNPQQRVYFVHDGEQVCNGRIQRISFEGITFSETGRDAFGKPLDRSVSKPLYPSAGVQR